jgi:hypothetical protein
MAQQRQFDQDQQGQDNERNAQTLSSDRGTGSRSATFVGGDIDEKTGNVVPGSKVTASKGFTVTGSEKPAATTATETVDEVYAQDPLKDTVKDEGTTEKTETKDESQPGYEAYYRDDKSNVVETVSKWFCYGAGVEILMENGTYKPVEKIDIGERVMLGGEVTAVGKAKGSFTFNYRGQRVSGSHAVFEDGRFVRVYEAKQRSTEDEYHGAIHPIATAKFLLVTRNHISADFCECEGGYDMTPVQRLSRMNREVERLQWLRSMEALYCNAVSVRP